MMGPKEDQPDGTEGARRAVQQAVRLLAEHLAITEDDATRRLETLAAQTKRTLQEVSESLLLGEELLKDDTPADKSNRP